MAYYIAWLNGCSVKRGTIEEVTEYARFVFTSDSWRATVTECGRKTVLRITKGARQTLVSEQEL